MGAPPRLIQAATLASKGRGRLIRCTVPGATPNCFAISRTPGLPGAANAFWIRASMSGISDVVINVCLL